ncbi:F-box only protein 15 [Neoarius graeffei]|uniref:F-box only protein 15 n=1 Tax=Neoarius graeffei TaxID=443677 RepID=UPI00298CF5FD|nr:F-box only protein 15 [Neoarius graeffei]
MPHRSSACTRLPPKLVRSSENYIQRMPPEIIEKITSYLDAGSLYCLGFVNKHFYEVVEHNIMWYRFYTWHRAKAKTSRQVKDVTDGVDMASILIKPKGHWRRVLFKELAHRNTNWKKKLKSVHPYTGLPTRTTEVLRSLGLTWELTVKEARRPEYKIKHTDVYFSETSLTVMWRSGNWPILDKPTTLELHGVIFVPINCPLICRPGRRSLLRKVVVKKDNGKLYGSDKLISLLYIKKGVTVGVWQKQMEIAFVLVSLHHHRLVERSLLGSSTTPYDSTEMQAPFDDIDPDYGLHGYRMHIELHNTRQSITSLGFSQLFCRKDQIADGYIPLQVIRKDDPSRHTHLCGLISLPWNTEALQGVIEHCCMLTLTVLTETQTPFWCVSAPVTITKSNDEEVSYDHHGERFLMEYKDDNGKLEVELEWVKEHEQFVIISFILFLSVSKVNRHFGRDY